MHLVMHSFISFVLFGSLACPSSCAFVCRCFGWSLEQADPAVASAKEAKAKVEEVVSQAKGVAETSKNAIEIARRQRKAKDATIRATEKALRSHRYTMWTGRRHVV